MKANTCSLYVFVRSRQPCAMYLPCFCLLASDHSVPAVHLSRVRAHRLPQHSTVPYLVEVCDAPPELDALLVFEFELLALELAFEFELFELDDDLA